MLTNFKKCMYLKVYCVKFSSILDLLFKAKDTAHWEFLFETNKVSTYLHTYHKYIDTLTIKIQSFSSVFSFNFFLHENKLGRSQ